MVKFEIKRNSLRKTGMLLTPIFIWNSGLPMSTIVSQRSLGLFGFN